MIIGYARTSTLDQIAGLEAQIPHEAREKEGSVPTIQHHPLIFFKALLTVM